MPASQKNIDQNTRMGANLISGGATFRVWAPNALKVYVIFNFSDDPQMEPVDQNLLLVMNNNGHWTGFIPNISDRAEYMFFVVGKGGLGRKRDPYARELAAPFPGPCIIRDPATFPWHTTGYHTPQFSDFVIYQLHVGVFYAPRLPKKGTFLDVISKIPYLSSLGITVIQLLPIQEYGSQFSQGYNNLDFFSPETDFAVDEASLPPYLTAVNTLLNAKGQQHYTLNDLKGEVNQLKALVDICHIYGLGVLFDQVYNHAGGDWGDQSLYFMDHQPTGTDNNSLYFIPGDFCGGLIFDFSKPDVRELLINNAKFFLEEYHVDGYRYDEVSTIDHRGQPNGWAFCQNLTSTLKYLHPDKLNHAEYWEVNPLVVQDAPAGAGFHTTLTNQLRLSIRDVISNASQPNDNPLNMDRLAQSLWPSGFDQEYQFVQGPENHDIVHIQQEQRMASLSDPSNARSWYATSRSRVSTGITMTAPGIPMLFMGQEFLEYKQWSEDFSYWPDQFIDWAGLAAQKTMSDFVHYTSDLINLRWQYPALRAQGFTAAHSNNTGRVLSYHRWVPGEGKDVLVIIHLGNSNAYNYRIGFPQGGTWKEVFNSDFYENFPNPDTCGNRGLINANNQPYDGFGYSASLILPANSILVFAK